MVEGERGGEEGEGEEGGWRERGEEWGGERRREVGRRRKVRKKELKRWRCQILFFPVPLGLQMLSPLLSAARWMWI